MSHSLLLDDEELLEDAPTPAVALCGHISMVRIYSSVLTAGPVFAASLSIDAC